MEKMRKKLEENAAMDQWLREQYIEEANEIERKVLQKEDMIRDEDIDMEEGYRGIMAKLQEKGIHMEESAEAPRFTEAPKPPKKEKKERFFLPKLGKAAAMAAMVVLGTFTISMTSQANRNYVLDTIRYLTGNDVRVMVSNDETRNVSGITEEEAMQEIQEKLRVQTPMFLYRPKGFKFVGHEIYEDAYTAQVRYQYEGQYIDLQINVSEAPTSLNIIPHGNKIDTIKTYSNKIDVQVFELESDIKADVPNFVAQWIYDNVGYQLSGKIDKEEFVEIIHQSMF